jgi:L-malate glycosyltransferase
MGMYNLDKSNSQMSKPNVLLLLNSFDTGGAEGQLVLLARLLRDSGRFGVHLACLSRSGRLLNEAEQLGVGLIPEFPLTSFYDWNMAVQLRRLAAFLRERKISVIHTEGFYTNVFGITGATLARTPARIAFRGSVDGWFTQQQEFTERTICRMASVVHANSQAVRNFLIGQGVPAAKIEVVYNGLDLARVTPPADLLPAEARVMFGLPTDANRPLVTIVANMRHEVKNYPMFLRAARRVHDAIPQAMFALAGEGEMAEQLRALTRELGLERDAYFIGRCDRVAELLFASDVCVLSSKAEGFSNSILEYMGAARPVVATDVGGAREAIIEGETGHLVRSEDDEAMAARIVSLLSDKQSARAMGDRGRQVVVQRFSSEVQLAATERLYDQVLACESPGPGKQEEPISRYETIS